MNTKLKKILATTLITAMVLGILPAFANGVAANSFWIEPDAVSFSTDTTSPGDTFIVTIWTNTSVDTYTWQCRVDFNPAHIIAVGVGYTGVGKSLFFTGHTTVPVSPVIDNVAGYVLHGESLSGDDYKEPDCDTLFWIEFEIVGVPGKGETLSSTMDTNSGDTYWLDPVLGTVTPVTKEDATYEYVWALPPSPHFAVVPQTKHYTQYDNATDPAFSDFDMDIKLMSLNAAWYVHNASVSVSYDPTLLAVIGVVVDPLWTGPNNVGIVPGTISIFVQNPSPAPPSGDVLIATITFRVLKQNIAPDPGFYCVIDIFDTEVWDTTLSVPLDPEIDGNVLVDAYLTMVLPYLEVSSMTMGPEPCRGEEFNVTVTLKNLDWHWYMVGIEFRLAYPADLIEPVAVYEGPFLPSYASFGTWWASFFETVPVEHVLYGELIFPAMNGTWYPPWLGEPDVPAEGVIAIITFRVAYQSFGEPDMYGDLEIIDQLAIGLNNPVDQDIVGIPMDPPVNGLYTITVDWPGRVLDLYGGALNEGYGSHPFPEPYGGQGPHNPMDLVVPQSEVRLFAEVTYNYWPVQQKLVGFEVEDPYGGILLKRTAVTNADGIADILFEMPWPCDDPESLFGVWKVTATVSISDVRVNDTLEFHYDYMVNIFKVTTDMFEYNHCDEVEITIEYGTHAQQMYPLLLSVLIMDDLIVPFGMVLVETEVGGAEFCTYTNFTTTVNIHIPKYAAAGIATIHVNAFDFDPTEGGVAWCPEYTPPPEIAIQPY